MNITIFHLSDLHLSDKSQIELLHMDKMLSLLNSTENVTDEYMVIVSGDITCKGTKEQYAIASYFIEQFMKRLTEKTQKTSPILIAPGNHDVNFHSFEMNADKIKTNYNEKGIEKHFNEYISRMSGFFDFSSKYGCFTGDKRIVSTKHMDYDGVSVGIELVNSAPFCLLGGKADDMGYHFLPEDVLCQVEKDADCDFNILVMHHSIEWFDSSVKSRLRDIINRKYNLILTGHEHEAVGENKRTNKVFETCGVQGNALLGEAAEGNGFCLIRVDTDNHKLNGDSYIWKKDAYIPTRIMDGDYQIYNSFGLVNDADFVEQMTRDENGRNYDDYYVFPGVQYKEAGEDEDILSWDEEDEESIDRLIGEYTIINICGGHKSGKSALASRLYRRLIAKRKCPILICADDIQKKKIDKTTRRGVEEQYGFGEEIFEKFTQIPIKDRIVLLDDASRIGTDTLAALIKHLEMYFGGIVLFSEETIDLDIKKRVMDVVDKKSVYLSINPFLYRTRFHLIKRFLQTKGVDKAIAENRAKEINDQINMQVKYFELDPQFIISFVNMYELQNENNVHFTAGMNVFSIVYDNSLKTRIIENAGNEKIDPVLVINVLRELAFYMHFSKMSAIKTTQFAEVVEKYNKEYRQNVNSRVALNVAINSKILIENDGGVYFRDRTLVAYFVAQALNHKYNSGDNIQEKMGYMLKHLCFGINSDIVLFLALVSGNPRILNAIINGARTHYADKDEFSLDKNNIPFMTETNIQVKNTLPDKREKERREQMIDEQEKEVHASEYIELVDEYNYTEDEVKDQKNQILTSFKYLEIISKALPAFCQDMKVDQQDKLVTLIYQCPNRFLFMMLDGISQNFKEFCAGLYEEVSELRRERGQVEISIDSIEKAITQVAAELVITLYQLVATTCASTKSIQAINDFKYENDANYRLQNLMMSGRVEGVKAFSKKAKCFDKLASYNLEKSIIKYTVRDYFLRNDVPLHGEAESLMAHFFRGKSREVISDRIIKNKYRSDREKKASGSSDRE